jgi:hypothetical protein
MNSARDIRIVHHYYGTLSPGACGYFRDVDTYDISAVIETQDRRHSPWLILTSAASLVAILNSVVLGTGRRVWPARWQAVSEAGTWRLAWPARRCAAGLRCSSNPGSSTRPSNNTASSRPLTGPFTQMNSAFR